LFVATSESHTACLRFVRQRGETHACGKRHGLAIAEQSTSLRVIRQPC
jgi:hypothetical protein